MNLLLFRTAESEFLTSSQGDDAFRPTYRALLRQRNSPRTPTPPPDRDFQLRAPTAPPSQLRFRLPGASPDSASSVRRAATPIQDDDDTRGSDDADVAITRETVVTRPRGHQNLVRRCALPISPSLTITKASQVVYSEPDPPKKPKAKRTAQADMDPKLSRAGKNVPAWISDDFESIILPIVFEHYGGLEDLWTLDTTKPTKGKAVVASSSTSTSKNDQALVDILQQLVDQLFPRKHYELATDDIIVRVVSTATQRSFRRVADRCFTDTSAHHELASRLSRPCNERCRSCLPRIQKSASSRIQRRRRQLGRRRDEAQHGLCFVGVPPHG